MMYSHTIGSHVYRFPDLRVLMARASPYRSGDALAGVCAENYQERIAAQMCLADVPLRNFLSEALIPYEEDEVTRLIMDGHDAAAFEPISSFTVGEFRDWLLGDDATAELIVQIKKGITPEMAAAVSKIMRNQDLVLGAQKCRVVTRFRNTIGLPGRFSTRLQPNHPTDDLKGIAASTIDGLMYGSGDAVIGINPASDEPGKVYALLHMLNALISKF
ncbi:MAG TPA: ethanolamine ammonia-lyase subunit EutB, partial [Chitinophagaceae bacterium]|nr:ethanolamine ammonia-lyase subunit EutB [Chitinophagaceae bacterium]